GEAVWAWRALRVSSWRKQVGPTRCRRCRSFANDGDKTNSSPRRARYKPLKPLRREGRTVSVNLWRLRSCAFLFACEAAGATSTWLSLRPLFLGKLFLHNPDAIRAAGRERAREIGP